MPPELTPALRPHIVRYQVLDPNRGNPVHEITVDATPAEIETLVEEGYLVRSGWFTVKSALVHSWENFTGNARISCR